MTYRRKLLALLVALAAMMPVFAAARAACCMPSADAARHDCCKPAVARPVTAMKGCCKAPAAPRPDARAKDLAPIGVMAATHVVTVPPLAAVPLPKAAAFRLARLGHRAPSPDDSPPDLLARHPALLI
jgi:hypothetical protein